MKFSIEWLQEFVDITLSPEDLAEKLTMAGFECEGIETIAASVSGVVTGQIKTIEKHPDADKLVITQIDTGNETVQIVTGANNIKEGDIVPVSLPGAVLAGGLKIKVSKLRGIESYGMLCSETELGLSEESAGIWILPADTPVGVDIVEWGKLNDTVLDLAILPNRGDCQNIVGVAREISVILKTPLKWTPKVPEPLDSSPKRSLSLSKCEGPDGTSIPVGINAPDACAAYTARRLSNIKQNRTPVWMQRRLMAMGIRPISIAVDITNYVMLELGQPLHAFDARKIATDGLCVRYSAAGESCTTLDGQKRSLPEQTLVIADSEQVLAIAGVMGGKSSEVTADTTDIILEAANFDKTIVRRKALECGLRSESSSRFEKGIPVESVALASNRAAQLFAELCNATHAEPVEVRGAQRLENEKALAEPLDSPPKRSLSLSKCDVQAAGIPFTIDKINQFLGSQFEDAICIEVLTALGFKIENNQAFAPVWRQGDVQGWQDLAEELIRILGDGSIEPILPVQSVTVAEATPKQRCIKALRQASRSLGLDNVVSFPMISPKDLELIGQRVNPNLELKNPLTPEESVMRPQLLPSLIKIAYHNQNRQQTNIRIMEIGRVFADHDQERDQCAVLIEGDQFPGAYQASDRRSSTTFNTLKGLAVQLIGQCGVENLEANASSDTRFHPKKSAEILVNGTVLATVGVLHPFLCETAGLNREFGYLEINVDQVAAVSSTEYRFEAFSKFPASDKDVAFLIPKSMLFKTLLETANTHQPKHCTSIQIFDYFESDDLGDNVSVALRLRFQDLKGTLSDEVVNAEHQAFTDQLSKELSISIR